MKEFFGLLPVVLAIPSYALYIRAVVNHKTIPHMYSWLIWSVLALVGFLAQIESNAGPGAWNTGVTSLACFIVFIVSIRYGEKHLSKIDAALLALAIVAIITRVFTDDYTLATSLATFAALVGFTFTIKKAYNHPAQENQVTFNINFLRNLVSLFALSSISYNTFFYPCMMMLANLAVVLVINVRTVAENT